MGGTIAARSVLAFVVDTSSLRMSDAARTQLVVPLRRYCMRRAQTSSGASVLLMRSGPPRAADPSRHPAAFGGHHQARTYADSIARPGAIMYAQRRGALMPSAAYTANASRSYVRACRGTNLASDMRTAAALSRNSSAS